MLTDSLKKQWKAIDLCLKACRRRQSPRTGFVHFFPGLDEPADTIPLYENFCFAIALYRQKTVDSALEGRELLERLLPFQAPDGNFPVYLHEFPRCRDWMQGLKIAPLLIQLLRRFATVLQPELKQKLSEAIDRILVFSKEKGSGPWPFRYRMCKERGPLQKPDPLRFSSSDWTEWLISAQLGEPGPIPLAHLFHQGLQAFVGPAHADIQEGYEPRPTPIEWLLAEKGGHFSDRLLRDHPLQIHLAALWPLEEISEGEPGWPLLSTPDCAITWQESEHKSAHLLRILWRGEQLHSVVLPQMKAKVSIQEGIEALFDLPEDADQTGNDLMEIALYCDRSSEIDLTINGKRGTTFHLGDWVEIKSPKQIIQVRFELASGTGDFRGHLSCANRPVQIPVKNFEAYDWQIGLRTLRRSPKAQIRAHVKIEGLTLSSSPRNPVL